MKLFISERGSDNILRFANAEDDRNKVVSALVRVEAASAICKLRQLAAITPAETQAALDSLAVELRRIIEQPVNPSVVDSAISMVDRHYLRAMDALQLGSAIVARDLLASPKMGFIACDKALKEAAHAEGFGVWDPTIDVAPKP